MESQDDVVQEVDKRNIKRIILLFLFIAIMSGMVLISLYQLYVFEEDQNVPDIPSWTLVTALILIPVTIIGLVALFIITFKRRI